MLNRYSARTGALEALAFALAVCFCFPLYLLVNLALSNSGALTMSISPTTSPQWHNFRRAWTEADLAPAMLNSFIVTVAAVALATVLAALAAYPIARSASRLSPLTFSMFLAGMLLPFQLGLIPLYKLMRDLDLLGSVWSVIIFGAGDQLPVSVFLFATFLKAVPLDFEEASKVDGCNSFQTFRHIVVPMLGPVAATVVIINTVRIWNDFFTPLLYLSGSDRQTLPVAIYSFVGEYTSDWPLIFSAIIISVIPVLAAYVFLQRYIISGLAGGLKG